MKRRSTRWIGLAGVLLALLAACSGPPATPQLPPITFTVDPTIKPPVASLPGSEDGAPRPLASVLGDDGMQAEFVANEVWLQSDDKAAVQAFVARWYGKVLKTLDPSAAGITGLGTQYLIRINAAAADTSKLSKDLRKLDSNATGSHKVSSQAGLDLIAASSHEAANGLHIGMNWVGSGSQFRDFTSLEAPSGSTLAGVGYTPNAFFWPSHSSGSSSVQDIGIAEAWRALDLAGKLGNRVRLAVLDMGFQPDADWRGGYQAISNVPFTDPIGTENLLWCSGGNDCPWHGSEVVSAAMALPDNNYGSAGSAGPVAEPIVVFTLYDFFTSIQALYDARLLGARIANMSYGTPVPWYLGWSVLPFEAATEAFRTTGMLLFAAAGNEGKDVDAEGCTFGICWERTWYTPCENAGVICVGGLQGNSKNKAGGSNYGGEQVDIFAPYTLWLGPDPSSPDNRARVENGTSFSSPFAAGVAALIWAADPSLSADEVEDILLETAHYSQDDRVKHYVNALGAVHEALGNVPPAITLGSGGDVQVNVELSLEADVFDFEDAFPCCTIIWRSDVDGVLGTGQLVKHTFTTLGSRTITVTATDSGGAASTARETLNVVNTPPTVEITKPVAAEEVYRDLPYLLRSTSRDINEPNGELACERLSWNSSLLTDPLPTTGCEPTVTFDSNGPRTLTLTGTDSQGKTGAVSVSIVVVDPPDNPPPLVRITSPRNGIYIGPDTRLTLSGEASDPEGESPLAYHWTVTYLTNTGPTTLDIGDGPSLEWAPSDTIPGLGCEFSMTAQLNLLVTDPSGGVSSDFILLYISLIC